MLFIIAIVSAIYRLAEPILMLAFYILLSPQCLLSYLKRVLIRNQDFHNLFQLSMYLLFQLLYLSVFCSVHWGLFVYFYFGESTLFLALYMAVIPFILGLCYRPLGLQFSILNDTERCFYYLSYEILWVIIFFCYAIRLGNRDLYDMLLFRTTHPDLISLWKFALFTLGETLLLMLLFFASLLHVLTPLSLIRMLEIVRHEHSNAIYIKLVISSFYIIQDALLMFAYIFNFLFILSFLKSHKEVYHIVFHTNIRYNQALFSRLERELFGDANAYCFIKYDIIINNLVINIKFIFGVVLALLSITFFWRIHITYRIISDFYVNNDFKQFVLEFCINIVHGLIDLILPLVFIYNHINPFNGIALYRARKYYSQFPQIDCRFSTLNLIIFIQKTLDYLVTIVSLSRGLYFTFLLYQLRLKRQGKLSSHFRYFPLMVESDSFIHYGKEEYQIENAQEKREERIELEVNNCLLKYLEFFQKRRLSLINWIVKTHKDNILLVLSLPSIIDPFQGLGTIKIVYSFVCDSLFKFEDQEGNKIKYRKVSEYFSAKIDKTVVNQVRDFLYFIPLNLLLILSGPWTLLIFLMFVYHHNANQIHKIKLIHQGLSHSSYIMKHGIYLRDKPTEHMNSCFTLWKDGWIILLKLLVIHLTVLRGVLFWYDYIRLIKYKKNKDNSNSSSNSNTTSTACRDSDTSKDISQDGQNLTFRTQLSESTIQYLQKSQNQEQSLFHFSLNKNFYPAIRELIFIPFILIMVIITPWHFFTLGSFFFGGNTFQHKLSTFGTLGKAFIGDFLTMLGVLLSLLSIVHTMSCIRLLYFAFLKAFIGDQNSITKYETNYKSGFKEEVRALSSGMVKKALIVLMLIINYCLIFRIPHVYRRTKRFFYAEYIKYISLLKKKVSWEKKKKTNKDSQSLDTLSTRCICLICEFLKPSSIYDVAAVNRAINEKTKVNLIWKNFYYNYYDKILKRSVNPETYGLFDPERYDNYYKACRKAHELSMFKDKVLTEDQRDNLIGLFNVLLEETFDSLLMLPHFLLIPAKIVSLVLIIIVGYLIKLNQIFFESWLYTNYLKYTFINWNFQVPVEISSLLSFEKIYILQEYGVSCIFTSLLIIVSNTVCSLFSLFIILIKSICLTKLRLPDIPIAFSFTEKLSHMSKIHIIYQLVLSAILIVLDLILIFLPFYYFHGEGVINLLNEHFNTDNNLPNSLLDPFNYYNFFLHATTIWWDKGFFGRIFYPCGSYLSNVIIILVNMFLIGAFYSIFEYMDVIIFNVLFYVIFPNGLLSHAFIFLVLLMLFLLFPHVFILKKLYHCLPKNILFNGIINILTLACIVYPFYLNFKITITFTNLLLLNTYGFTNVILFAKHLG